VTKIDADSENINAFFLCHAHIKPTRNAGNIPVKNIMDISIISAPALEAYAVAENKNGKADPILISEGDFS